MTQNNKKFFITTPIYYTNGVPHIGHSYSSIIADVLFRYNKQKGADVKFSTGVDENSQKVVEEAEKALVTPKEFTDIMADKHKAVWDGLDISYTDFIRTTEPRHHEFVQKILQKTFDNGDIYEGVYKGKYCVGCEGFKKDTDLVESDGKYEELGIKKGEKICPDHPNKHVSELEEKNYFFRLSKYQKFLEEFYENNPDFIFPKHRKNEILAFIKDGLEDFSISREGNTFGIPLPFDESQVAYVWYDALLNYLTVCQGGDEDFWPAVHVVGKEITRFHGIYWLAMLKSAGFELPKKLIVTGFLTVDGEKIAKSIGNVIDPVEFSKKYSRDALVLYLLHNLNIGSDGDFNQEACIKLYNDFLANNFGNLVNRVKVLSGKILVVNSGLRSLQDNLVLLDGDLDIEIGSEKILKFNSLMQEYKIKEALENVFSYLDDLNKYLNDKAPWILLKDEKNSEEVKNILTTVAVGIEIVTRSLKPFFPEKMEELSQNIKFTEDGILVNTKAGILFEKLELVED